MKNRTLIIGLIILLIIIGIIYFANTKQERSVQPVGPIKIDITWEEAVRILNEGQVASVSQSHNLDVILYLKDGTIINTKEPNMDDIIIEVQKCGEPCKDILIATE